MQTKQSKIERLITRIAATDLKIASLSSLKRLTHKKEIDKAELAEAEAEDLKQ